MQEGLIFISQTNKMHSIHLPYRRKRSVKASDHKSDTVIYNTANNAPGYKRCILIYIYNIYYKLSFFFMIFMLNKL